jgi:PIN domain nuclease of toxin-antitoxin system
MQAARLDTRAAVWIAENEKRAPHAITVPRNVQQADSPTCVSPVTAWEIGRPAARDQLKLLIERSFLRLYPRRNEAGKTRMTGDEF